MARSLSLPVVERSTGILLWEGKSLLNGKPIVVIATGRSENEKTGGMIQVWILVRNQQPLEAHREGADEAICGSCKHRHFRSCYVNLARGPLQVWQTYEAGKYPKLKGHAASEYFRDKVVRLGAYGDPAAVPVEVWDTVTRVCRGWTGYTHQWKRCDKRLRNYCMASADTLEEAYDAMDRGWKPFYVRAEHDPLPKGFFSCPASKEEGTRLTCEQCRACHGGEYRGQGVPSIILHSSNWKKIYFHRGMKRMRNKEKYVGMAWAG